MNKKTKIILACIIGVILMTGLFYMAGNKVFGKVPAKPSQIWTNETHDFFVATTTTAASTPRLAGGAKKITFFFYRGWGTTNTGTSTFSVQVTKEISPAETDWVTYNKLIDNVANATANGLTRVGSAVFSASSNADTSIGGATSTKMYSMDLTSDGFQLVRCVVNEQTDGKHSCSAYIEY